MADDNLDEQIENWVSVGAQIFAGAFPGVSADAISDIFTNAGIKGHAGIMAFVLKAAKSAAATAGQTLTDLEEPILPIFAAFIAPVIASMFGSTAGADAFSSRGNTDARNQASADLVSAFLDEITGGADGEQEPSDEGAKRLAGAGVHAAMEGWFNAWILEMLGELVPWDWLHFREMTALPDEIIRSLGIGRLVRRALQPLVNATAVQPMTWKTNKQYRPKLLSEATAIREFQRGKWAWEDVVEELARTGYNDARIDALKNEQRKFIAAAEVAILSRHIGSDTFDPVEYLGEAGYDTGDAQRALLVEDTKRLETQQDTLATILVDAYSRRVIDQPTFYEGISALSMPQLDMDRYKHQGDVRLSLSTKFLSRAEAEECYMADVIPIAMVREAYQREGYDSDSATALELLLDSKKITAVSKKELAQQKADAAAKVKADAQAKADARTQQIEQQRKIKAEGPIADWKRGVATGAVPLAEYQAMLNERYDGPTVALLSQQAQDARTAYLAQQQKAADAAKRAAEKGLNVGQLEAAVYAGVLNVQEFRAALDTAKIDPADADILAATVQAKLADQTAAKAKRAAAAQKAATKHIDLSMFEQLVVAGHKTIDDYSAFLQSLGYDAPSVASMVDLVNVKIANATKARSIRAATAAAGGQVALTFAELRRAVVLGDAPIDDFAKFLADHNYAPDAQTILLDELRGDVSIAEAARQKRAAATAAGGDSRVSAASLAKAARLGVITQADYATRLQAIGYTADDVSIEMDLLAAEASSTAAKKTKAATITAASPAKALTLSQVAGAVKKGELTIDDYRAKAAELGYSAADAEILVEVLQDELDATKIAADLAGDTAPPAP